MMRHLVIIFLVVLAAFVFWYVTKEQPTKAFPIEEEMVLDSTVIGVSTVASGLDVPWEITWGPDDHIWMTEQGGTVSRLNPKTGKRKVLLQMPDVFRKRSMGLLGMAVSPNLEKQPYVFLDYTYLKGKNILSKLVRYTFRKDTLVEPLVLLNDIPGANGHNGSRITIAPGGKLIMSTGDATVAANSQNTASINGKILRLNFDGSIPADNPIAGSPVWSWGHRNIQGLGYGPKGILYSSEHGDAIEDELNIITQGANYGWPDVEGVCDIETEKTYCAANAITEPITSWTPTIAPAGVEAYEHNNIPEWNNALLLTTLKAASLYVLNLSADGRKIVKEKVYFTKKYGRIRDVCVSPAGDVYLSTSNRDWNPGEGFPKQIDDRIIRITKLRTDKNAAKTTPAATASKAPVTLAAGQAVYVNYCAACHKEGGEGVTGNFPPLKNNPRVLGNNAALVNIVLNGMSGSIKVDGVEYNQPMPGFSFLSDKDVAEVVSYIRTNFGNNAGKVTEEEVQKMRKVKP